MKKGKFLRTKNVDLAYVYKSISTVSASNQSTNQSCPTNIFHQFLKIGTT